MLDMGGAPSAATSKNAVRVQNTSKNSKVQAVAFDFELLVRAIQEQADDAHSLPETPPPPSSSSAASSALPSASKVTPDVGQIQEVAKLLNVDLNDKSGLIRKSEPSYEKDDLSALLGTVEPEQKEKTSTIRDKKPDPSSKENKIPSSLQDIRAKYANKLHKAGVDGGIAGVELLKYQREEALKRGDAEGHFAARKNALNSAVSSSASSSNKWMALTGTGKLLSTLNHRSMKIALLPRLKPTANQNAGDFTRDQSSYERMLTLTRQLKDVVFDVLIDVPAVADDKDTAVKSMVEKALQELKLEPKVILFVSDQDVFLKHAKELGMMTCRIQPLNARRGNISAHYNVPSILGIHDVVNEMNKISFNTVLNM